MSTQHWIKRRPLKELVALAQSSLEVIKGPDASILVWAMAEFIRLAGVPSGMPTLRQTKEGERLMNGARLLQALSEAGYEREVDCIVVCDSNRPPKDIAAEFSALEAAQRGTDARVVTFERQLPPEEEREFCWLWSAPPKRISSRSFGWDEDTVRASLPEWIVRCRELELFSQTQSSILVINGRYAAWIPRSARHLNSNSAIPVLVNRLSV
jgi:hypothetical protein